MVGIRTVCIIYKYTKKNDGVIFAVSDGYTLK